MDRYKINSDLFKQVNFNIENLIGKNLLQYKQEFSEISRLIESMNKTNFSHLLQPSYEISQLVQQNSEISRLFESTNKTNFSHLLQPSYEISRLLKSLSQSELSSQFGYDKNRIIELTKGLDLGLNKNVISSLSRTLKITELAQSSLEKLNFLAIDSSLQTYSDLRDSLYNSFFSFSSSYSNLTVSLEELILGNSTAARIVSELPALELLNSVEVIESVSIVDLNTDIEDEIEVEKQSIKNEFIAERKEIESLLITIGSHDLIPMWQGAQAALNSIDNPDYARHCAVSLREFFTQIIHRLSPDEDIKKWTEDPHCFDKGRPTRKARLLFICRSINYNIFSDFIEKDVEAILEFVKLFQRGTHQVTIPFTHKQLLALKARVESAINFLIEIAQLNE
jgi:Predicted pPIWI-associating nuclease